MDHSEETDGHNWHNWWTSRLTFSQSNSSVFWLHLRILYFPAWVNVPENLSLHRLARSMSQFTAQQWQREKLPIKMPTWTIAQHHQNTKLEATPSVKNCSSGQLEATGGSGSGRPVAAEDSSSSRHWWRKVHQEVQRSCKKIQAAERGWARILRSSIGEYSCKIWRRSFQSRFRAQRCNLEPIHKRLHLGFILTDIGSRRLSKGCRWTEVSQEHKIWCSPYNDKWEQWRNATTHTTCNYCRIEHISLVKNTLLSDPAAELIRTKVHVFSDSALCVGISNPDPSNNWATKLDDV